MAAVAALALALAMVWQGWVQFRRDLVFTAAETEVSFWGRDDYQPTAITRERTGRQLESLLAQVPDHPEYQLLAASYFAWQAYWTDDAALAARFSRRAQWARDAARESRPAYVYNEAGETGLPE